jgi:hypothetical protein
MKTKDFRNDTDVLQTGSFFGKDAASFNGFISFCGRNMPLVISVTLACLFVYGAVLFNIVIAGDTIQYLADSNVYKQMHIGGGRWAAVLLAKLFFIKESGVYASAFISAISIWTFSMLFCYFIAVLTQNTKRRNGFIPLALTVLTYSVWPQYFMFFYQNKIQTIFVCLTLINVYILYKGFLSRKKAYLVISFLLTVLSFGIYQPFFPLFLCLVFIYFILLQENSNFPSKEYSLLCLKLFCFFVAAFAVSTAIDRIVQSAFNIPPSDYITGQMFWNQSGGIRTIFINICAQIYVLTIGLIPFVHSFFSPIMANLYGNALDPFGRPIFDTVFSQSRAIGNILLLPAVIIFLVLIFINAKQRIQKDRRLLYVLAGIGIPVSILFLTFVGGEVLGTRILYCLPFAAAFMFYYVASKQKTFLSNVFYCLILATSFYQAQISQGLLEASARTAEFDAKIAFDLDARIREVLENDNRLPVAYIGNINHPFKPQRFTIEMAGRSVFEWWVPSDISNQTKYHVVQFMNLCGFHYDVPTPEQMRDAYEASRSMPAYPSAGSVKKLGDVVVVKLGD